MKKPQNNTEWKKKPMNVFLKRQVFKMQLPGKTWIQMINNRFGEADSLKMKKKGG